MPISSGRWCMKAQFRIRHDETAPRCGAPKQIRGEEASPTRGREIMNYTRLSATVPSGYILSTGMLVIVVSASLWAADVHKEFKYNAAPRSTVKVSNSSGAVVVHTVSGRQVIIAATSHSDKVQVQSSQMGNHINAATEF